MRIGADLHAQIFRALLLAPDSPEAEEKTLLGRESVDALAFFSGLVFRDQALQRGESDARAAVVSGVFAQRETAVELQVIDGNEVGILVGHATHALLKLLAILLGPPVAQVARRIELAALIVEAVGKFVTDDQANATEVDSVIHGLVEERGLQNAGGKHDLVKRAVVI